MGSIEFKYETDNNTLTCYAEFIGSEDDGSYISMIEIQDEFGNTIELESLTKDDQEKIENKLQYEADQNSYEDWCENQIALAENYYEGDR